MKGPMPSVAEVLKTNVAFGRIRFNASRLDADGRTLVRYDWFSHKFIDCYSYCAIDDVAAADFGKDVVTSFQQAAGF